MKVLTAAILLGLAACGARTLPVRSAENGGGGNSGTGTMAGTIMTGGTDGHGAGDDATETPAPVHR